MERGARSERPQLRGISMGPRDPVVQALAHFRQPQAARTSGRELNLVRSFKEIHGEQNGQPLPNSSTKCNTISTRRDASRVIGAGTD